MQSLEIKFSRHQANQNYLWTSIPVGLATLAALYLKASLRPDLFKMQTVFLIVALFFVGIIARYLYFKYADNASYKLLLDNKGVQLFKEESVQQNINWDDVESVYLMNSNGFRLVEIEDKTTRIKFDDSLGSVRKVEEFVLDKVLPDVIIRGSPPRLKAYLFLLIVGVLIWVSRNWFLSLLKFWLLVIAIGLLWIFRVNIRRYLFNH